MLSNICKMIALAALISVAACNSNPTATTIAATGNALAAAQDTAIKYTTLPVCPVGATKMPDGTLCQNPAVTVKIKAASADATRLYLVAYNSQTSADSTAASTALAVLVALLPIVTN
jgi:hypothetical protein